MRLVLDTNSIVSGLLWNGPPRRLLEVARRGEVQLFTSTVLLAELLEVLSRPKFETRFAAAGTTPLELVLGYAALAGIVDPIDVPAVVSADPDDDHVLACAVAADAAVVISGDSHLIQIGKYNDIEIRTAAEFMKATG